jgi:hypothetical protein
LLDLTSDKYDICISIIGVVGLEIGKIFQVRLQAKIPTFINPISEIDCALRGT